MNNLAPVVWISRVIPKPVENRENSTIPQCGWQPHLLQVLPRSVRFCAFQKGPRGPESVRDSGSVTRRRRGGRVVEGARLESVYTPKAYRGFESRPLRQFH